MSTRGFNYKKRRDWPARGARREWPPLNVQETDPSLVSNINTLVGVGAGQLTWIAITADTISIPDSVTTIIASSDFVVEDTGTGNVAPAISSDYPSSAWLTSGTHSFRFPRAGLFSIVARAVWDGNTTGTRFLSVDTLVRAGEDNFITDKAADVFAGSNSDQTVPNVGYTSGGEFVNITVFQDSGAARTCTFHVFIAYVSSAGAAGGTGGGGAVVTLQETWAVLVNGSNQNISNNNLEYLTEAGLTMSVTASSSDLVSGDWLGSATGILRFPRAGQVTVAGGIGWDTNAVGDRELEVTIGNTYPGTYVESNSAAELITAHTTTAFQSISAVGVVSAGDSLFLQGFQDSGGARNVTDVFIWVSYTPILA